MIYTFTNSRQVISKVFRDFGVQDNDWINDAVEWMGEALEHIGTSRQVIPKLRIQKVNNFRIRIPKDIYSLNNIRYSLDTGDTPPKIDQFKWRASRDDTDHHPGFFGEESFSLGRGQHTYFWDGKFFKFSFEEGWVAIDYEAFALDDKGYPLIPDAVEYKEALSWYIISKMLLRGLRHPVVNYEVAHQQWLKYAGQARNQSNMPDKDAYREFRKRWVTMIPLYERSFGDLEGPEVTADNVIEFGHPNKISRTIS